MHSPATHTLSNAEIARYSRQILVNEIGVTGQERLINAAVLVVGAGGLGSPILQYLAAAGVGIIGIVDYDIVEESNLQRQVIHSEKSIGKNKVDSAIEFIKKY
jgi:adenylyltransferase/sulfurtransferase